MIILKTIVGAYALPVEVNSSALAGLINIPNGTSVIPVCTDGRPETNRFADINTKKLRRLKEKSKKSGGGTGFYITEFPFDEATYYQKAKTGLLKVKTNPNKHTEKRVNNFRPRHKKTDLYHRRY